MCTTVSGPHAGSAHAAGFGSPSASLGGQFAGVTPLDSGGESQAEQDKQEKPEEEEPEEGQPEAGGGDSSGWQSRAAEEPAGPSPAYGGAAWNGGGANRYQDSVSGAQFRPEIAAGPKIIEGSVISDLPAIEPYH